MNKKINIAHLLYFRIVAQKENYISFLMNEYKLPEEQANKSLRKFLKTCQSKMFVYNNTYELQDDKEEYYLLDKETKEKANELFNKFGLTMTTAVNMFLKTAIRENRIPFELKLEEEPNEVTLEAMREADRIARDDSVKGYDSIEELREALGV